MVELGRVKQKVGHILIARPDKAGAAQARLKQMGIDAMTLPAITPTGLSEGMAQAGYVRFNGGSIARTPAQQGAALSHITALAMGRAHQWEWVGLWEEDVDGVAALGARELKLPPDCGVVYLGGILWGQARDYGHEMDSPGQGVWRVAQPWPISCTHAVMIHASAMDDVIASCARMDMTADDCVSRACIEATTRGKWSTCFVHPWIAWQVDRRETWPARELSEEVERKETKTNTR
jgi:hypothetical protein